jgi:hypothetical protein
VVRVPFSIEFVSIAPEFFVGIGPMSSSAATVSRRQVRYQSFDEVLADAQRAVQDRAGTTGQWSLGRILEHLAIANEKTIDGFHFLAPLPVRIIAGTFLKKRFIKRGLKPGFRLSKKAEQILVPGEIDPNQALDHLRRSVKRLQAETERSLHPFFGRVTLDESNRLNLRHAELHMSFVKAT